MMFLIFIPPALFSSGLISSPIVLELLMTVGAAGFVSVAIWHVSKYGENPEVLTQKAGIHIGKPPT